MHTRLRNSPDLAMVESNVRWATTQLLKAARANQLDEVEGLRLPDLVLLAHLQHHGAATPLLDVTVDPLVALWMVAYAAETDPSGGDEDDGALFAIHRPQRDRWLQPLDSLPYSAEDGLDIAHRIANGVYWYRPPEISERLRIQRGSFLIGPLSVDAAVTFPLNWESRSKSWLRRRIKSIGRAGHRVARGTDVARFRVPGPLKPLLRTWLEDRAGLTPGVIYPVPWHGPFLEEFCRTYDRARLLDHESRDI